MYDDPDALASNVWGKRKNAHGGVTCELNCICSCLGLVPSKWLVASGCVTPTPAVPPLLAHLHPTISSSSPPSPSAQSYKQTTPAQVNMAYHDQLPEPVQPSTARRAQLSPWQPSPDQHQQPSLSQPSAAQQSPAQPSPAPPARPVQPSPPQPHLLEVQSRNC